MPTSPQQHDALEELSGVMDRLEGGGQGQGLRSRQDRDRRIQVAGGGERVSAATSPVAAGTGGFDGVGAGFEFAAPEVGDGSIQPGHGAAGEDPNARLDRLTQEVIQGDRTMDSIRESVDRIQGRHGSQWHDYSGLPDDFDHLAGDQSFLDEGTLGTRARIEQIFGNRGVPLEQHFNAPDRGETEGERLHRIAQEVYTGQRTLDDVRESVDRLSRQQDPSELWTNYPGASEGFTGTEGDDHYLGDPEALQERVRQIFGNRMVPIGREGVTGGDIGSGVIPEERERGISPRVDAPEQRNVSDPLPSGAIGGVERVRNIADDVVGGDRTLDDVRDSVQRILDRHGQSWDGYSGLPGRYSDFRDRDFLDAGRDAVAERVRQIFGDAGVSLFQHLDV